MIKGPTARMYRSAPRRKQVIYSYTQDENPNLNEIVIEVINGLHMKHVEPDLYPLLLPLLVEKDRALKEWRNQPASKLLEEAIDYIKKYRYCDDPELQVRDVTASKQKFTPREIKYNVELALRGEYASIEPQLHSTVLRELQNIRAEALASSDYLRAEKAVTAWRRVLALRSDNKFSQIATAKVDELGDKLDTKREDSENTKEDWERQIENAKRKRDHDIAMIEKQNARELAKFDEQFDLETPAVYRKFSPQYLTLRFQEKHMVISGRYAEATAVKEEANQLEKIEIEEQRQRYVNDLKLKREEIVNKQQETLHVRKVNADNVIAKMQRAAELAIDHQKKAVQHLEHQFAGATATLALGSRTSTRGPQSARVSSLPPINQPQSKAAAFRQRALINTIVYSKHPGQKKNG